MAVRRVCRLDLRTPQLALVSDSDHEVYPAYSTNWIRQIRTLKVFAGRGSADGEHGRGRRLSTSTEVGNTE